MINREIEDHYKSGIELDRLFVGVGQLERVRTQEIVLRHIQKTPSKIIDVGGGTGFYSFWLNDLGHEVHLIDPVQLHIQEAKNISRKSKRNLASISVGEARYLEFEDGYFDIVLFLGPLYHLTKREERMRALAEAYRVLSKEGLIFCIAISRYASMLDGFFRNLIKDTRFIKIMNRDLKDGQHRNTTEILDYWTTAYLHHPAELKEEIIEAGFHFRTLIGIDGFGWLLSDFNEKWQNQEYRELLLEKLRTVESDASLVGMSAHIMGIASK